MQPVKYWEIIAGKLSAAGYTGILSRGNSRRLAIYRRRLCLFWWWSQIYRPIWRTFERVPRIRSDTVV